LLYAQKQHAIGPWLSVKKSVMCSTTIVDITFVFNFAIFCNVTWVETSNAQAAQAALADTIYYIVLLHWVYIIEAIGATRE